MTHDEMLHTLLVQAKKLVAEAENLEADGFLADALAKYGDSCTIKSYVFGDHPRAVEDRVRIARILQKLGRVRASKSNEEYVRQIMKSSLRAEDYSDEYPLEELFRSWYTKPAYDKDDPPVTRPLCVLGGLPDHDRVREMTANLTTPIWTEEV